MYKTDEATKTEITYADSDATKTHTGPRLSRGCASIFALVVVAVGSLAACSGAPEPHPSEAVKAYVADMVNRWDTDGPEATIAYYNRPESADGELYGAITRDGVIVAHPYNPEYVGQSSLPVTDLTGNQLTTTGADPIPAEGAWFSYGHHSPVTGELMLKHTFTVMHDDAAFSSGWYEPIRPEG